MENEKKVNPFNTELSCLHEIQSSLHLLELSILSLRKMADSLFAKERKFAEELSWKIKMSGGQIIDYGLLPLQIPHHVVSSVRVAVEKSFTPLDVNPLKVLQFFEADSVVRDVLSEKLGYVVESPFLALDRERDWHNPYQYRTFSEAEIALLANEVLNEFIQNPHKEDLQAAG